MKANIAGAKPVAPEPKSDKGQDQRMEPTAYKLPCGLIEPLNTRNQPWQLDSACLMTGCQNCIYAPKDGSRPVKQDIARGVAIWAAHERTAIQKGERQEEINKLAGAIGKLIELGNRK